RRVRQGLDRRGPGGGPQAASGPPPGSVDAAAVDRCARGVPARVRPSGGLHAAAVCLPDGTVLAAAEDVGRHNAVDKAIGALSTRRWPFGEVVLAVSGRISFEITQKAAVVGIPVVAGVSAASSLAAEVGDELGLTVIGCSRGNRFVVSSGADRLTGLG